MSNREDVSVFLRRNVREKYPNAEVVPDGLMFVIRAGDKILSQRKGDTTKAWQSAFHLLEANRP